MVYSPLFLNLGPGQMFPCTIDKLGQAVLKDHAAVARALIHVTLFIGLVKRYARDIDPLVGYLRRIEFLGYQRLEKVRCSVIDQG